MRCKYCDSCNVKFSGYYEDPDKKPVLEGWICFDCGNDFVMKMPEDRGELLPIGA